MVDRIIHIVAGLMITISLLFGAEASPLFLDQWFLALAAFVGLNLLQYGITTFCPMGIILRKLGVEDNVSVPE